MERYTKYYIANAFEVKKKLFPPRIWRSCGRSIESNHEGKRRSEAFRIESEHEQDDQGGDPEESDQEGQEIRCGSVRVAHVNERSLCLRIALGRGQPFAGKPRTERREKQENS